MLLPGNGEKGGPFILDPQNTHTVDGNSMWKKKKKYLQNPNVVLTGPHELGVKGREQREGTEGRREGKVGGK